MGHVQIMPPPRTPSWDPSAMHGYKRPVLMSYIGGVHRVNDTESVKAGQGIELLWRVKLAVRVV